MLLIGAWFLLSAPMFRVTALVPLGADFTQEELDDNFNWSAFEGEYLWAVWGSRGHLKTVIEEHPRIASADLHFVLPNRIEVSLTEKERYATLVTGDQAFWVARDFSFYGLEPVGLVTTSRVVTGLPPHFLFGPDGAPLDDPFPVWPPSPEGEDAPRYTYAKIMQLWRWMDAEDEPRVSQVAAIEFAPKRGLILHYRLGVDRLHPPILVGFGPDLEKKYGQALTVYRSKRWWDETGVEIDLHSSRNVVRTLGPTLSEEPGTMAASDRESEPRENVSSWRPPA